MLILIIVSCVIAYKVGCIMALNKFTTGSCFKFRKGVPWEVKTSKKKR